MKTIRRNETGRLYIFFTKATEIRSVSSNVIDKTARSISSKTLYLSSANDMKTSKFFGARLGIMVNLENQGQKLESLRRGVDQAKSFSKKNRNLATVRLSSYLPEGAAQKVMRDLVLSITTSKNAWQTQRLMHSVACCPAANVSFKNAHQRMLLEES